MHGKSFNTCLTEQVYMKLSLTTIKFLVDIQRIPLKADLLKRSKKIFNSFVRSYSVHPVVIVINGLKDPTCAHFEKHWSQGYQI